MRGRASRPSRRVSAPALVPSRRRLGTLARGPKGRRGNAPRTSGRRGGKKWWPRPESNWRHPHFQSQEEVRKGAYLRLLPRHPQSGPVTGGHPHGPAALYGPSRVGPFAHPRRGFTPRAPRNLRPPSDSLLREDEAHPLRAGRTALVELVGPRQATKPFGPTGPRFMPLRGGDTPRQGLPIVRITIPDCDGCEAIDRLRPFTAPAFLRRDEKEGVPCPVIRSRKRRHSRSR